MKCPHEPCAEKKLIGGCAIQYNISILLFVWCFAHMKEKVGTKQLTLLHQSTEEETKKKKKKKKWYLSSLFFFSPSGSCSSSRSSEVYIYIYTPKAELLLRQVAFYFFFFFFFCRIIKVCLLDYYHTNYKECIISIRQEIKVRNSKTLPKYTILIH